MTAIDKWQEQNGETKTILMAESDVRVLAEYRATLMSPSEIWEIILANARPQTTDGKDKAELESYRAAGLSPVEIRALNNMLTIMRTFIEAVDSDEYSLKPLTGNQQAMDEFWGDSEAWDK